MVSADAVRAVVQVAIAVDFAMNTAAWWHLAVSSAVLGAAAAFFGPASTGVVPQIVAAERLQEANALIALSRSAIDIAGPAVSGVLVAEVGYAVVFAVDGASFVASGCFLVAARLPPTRPAAPQPLLDAFREGASEVRMPWTG